MVGVTVNDNFIDMDHSVRCLETKQHGVGLRSIAWQPGDSGRIAVGLYEMSLL